MPTTGKNFSRQATPSIVDDHYIRCNFQQETAHTRIFPGDDTPRTFERCNMRNCDLPPGCSLIRSANCHLLRDAANDDVVTLDGVEIAREEAWEWGDYP